MLRGNRGGRYSASWRRNFTPRCGLDCTTCIIDTFHYPYRVSCTRKHAEIDEPSTRWAKIGEGGTEEDGRREVGGRGIRWKAIAGGLSLCAEAALIRFPEGTVRAKSTSTTPFIWKPPLFSTIKRPERRGSSVCPRNTLGLADKAGDFDWSRGWGGINTGICALGEPRRRGLFIAIPSTSQEFS